MVGTSTQSHPWAALLPLTFTNSDSKHSHQPSTEIITGRKALNNSCSHLTQAMAYLIASRDPVRVQLLSGIPALSGAICILHPDSFWSRLICSPPRPITVEIRNTRQKYIKTKWNVLICKNYVASIPRTTSTIVTKQATRNNMEHLTK